MVSLILSHRIPLEQIRKFPDKGGTRQNEIATRLARAGDEVALDVGDKSYGWNAFRSHVGFERPHYFQGIP